MSYLPQDLVFCLKQESEPLHCQLLHVGVREGVGLKATRERTPLVQVHVAILSPITPDCPGPQGQEQAGLFSSHTHHIGECLEAVQIRLLSILNLHSFILIRYINAALLALEVIAGHVANLTAT